MIDDSTLEIHAKRLGMTLDELKAEAERLEWSVEQLIQHLAKEQRIKSVMMTDE